MTHYTIDELETLARSPLQTERAREAGNVREHTSTSSDVPVETSFALPDFRVDIRREILDAVRDAGRAVTRAEIARAVGRKKTTWLNAQIENCVLEGLLTRDQGYWKNGVVMYFYEVAR